MAASITLRQFARNLPKLAKTGISLELISAPGRGKSSAVAQYVAERRAAGVNLGFATLFLATQTPPDLIGYIMKGEREFDTKDGIVKVDVSAPTLPSWMTDDDTGKPCWAYDEFVLFLDEYGQAEGDVKRASAELLLNRRLGPWKLPKNSIVIAASNRAEDRSGVTRTFDFVINRRTEYHIRDDIEGWELDFAVPSNLHPLGISFAKEYPAIVFSSTVPKEQGPWCTPRSLVMAVRQLEALADDPDELPTDAFAVATVEGTIGTAATAQFFTHVKLFNSMPSYDSIVANPTKVDVPDAADAKMLIMHKLAHQLKLPDAGPCIQYIERLGKEFAITFGRTAITRQPRLLREPAFDAWLKENTSLVNAIGALKVR